MDVKGIESTPLQEAVNRSYTRAGGWSTSEVWVGRADDLKSKADEAIPSDPSDIKIDRIGETPYYRLQITWATDADPGNPGTDPPPIINTFELLDNQLQQPTAESEVLKALINNDSIVASIADLHNSYLKNEKTRAECITEISGYGGDAATYGNLWFIDLTKGLQTFLNFHYVLRRTITVVVPSQARASFYGIKEVWTTTQVLNYELTGYDDLLFFDSLATYLPNIKWLKAPPNVISATGQRMQISYEYWGADEWSSLYYRAHA